MRTRQILNNAKVHIIADKYDISMHNMLSLILRAHSMQLNYGLPLMLTLSTCEKAVHGEFKISFTSPWAFLQADMYVECSAAR